MARNSQNEAFLRTSFLSAANAPYIEDMQAEYERRGEPAGAVRIVHLGGAFQEPRMQVEHVARIGLAPGRAAKEQRHLPIAHRLLGEVVVDDDRMHAVVAEVFAHGAAGERGQVLHRRRVGRGRRDDDRIVERALLLEHFGELHHGRAFLPDRDVDAIKLDLLVVRRVERLLIEDGVERDRGLAGLPVPDDQLTLAAPDRNEFGSC